MSKYFVEEKEEKILLSKYLKELEIEQEAGLKRPRYFNSRVFEEVKQVIEYIGDVELPRTIIRALHSQFHCYGGKYDVRCEKETFQRVYQIYTLYPNLSARALESIIFLYIKDLFDKYSFDELLGKFIKVMGQSDETFELYYEYVDKKGEELQKEYEQIAQKMDVYEKEYGKRYVDYLKYLIIRKHVQMDKILLSMPSAELIKTDEKQLDSLSERTRIYFGVGYPVSYSLTSTLAQGKDISVYPEELSYHISTTDKKVPATFTKQEFLDSIKKEKQIKKI